MYLTLFLTTTKPHSYTLENRLNQPPLTKILPLVMQFNQMLPFEGQNLSDDQKITTGLGLSQTRD